MAPFKFEEDIKSVLEKRTITPSKKGWNELEKTLEKTSKPNKKKGFWWIGVAASVVGILWVSISFFNKGEVIVEPIIVETPKENSSTPFTKNINEEEKIEQVVAIEKPVNEDLIAVEAPSRISKKRKAPEIESYKNKEVEKGILVTKVSIESPKSISEEDMQLQEVAAQVAVLEKENATDAEIDLLLKNAQQKITDKKIKESGMSVSAYALLFEVEEELDPTFKDKVFKILSENYSSVKNAVAQRNE